MRSELNPQLDDLLNELALRPKDIESYRSLLEYYVQEDMFDRAEALIEQSDQSIAPLAGEIYATRLFDQRKFARCRQVIASLINRFPGAPQVLVVQGLLFCREGRYEEARKIIRRAYKLDESRESTKLAMLRVARLRQDFKQADHWLKLVSDEDPPTDSLIDFMYACINTANYQRFARLSAPLEMLEDFPTEKLSELLGFPSIRAMNDSNENITKFLQLERKWCDWASEQAKQNPLPPRDWRHEQRVRLGFFGLATIDLLRALLYNIVEHIDHTKYEVVLLFAGVDDTPSVDSELEELRSKGKIASFKVMKGTDRELAAQLQEEEVDVLIDLNGLQQAGTRLAALAWRPARVQMTWAGTPTNCGLKELDYQILDPFLVPEDPAFVSDNPLVLPRSWVCFGRFPDHEITPELPSERNGYVTFGVNAIPNRLNSDCFYYWSKLVKALPNSKLVFLNKAYANQIVRENILERMRELGIEDRVTFRFENEDNRGHMKWFNDVDLILDRVPISGGMGVLEALYMGVPVVSFVGPAVHTRLAWSEYNHLDIADLCCPDMESLIQKAQEVALDTDRRKELRVKLRDRINQDTTFTDIEAFMEDFHVALSEVCQQANLA